MRILVALLLLANLLWAGYLWLEGASSGEGERLREQVQPDKIKLLTPQEVAALGPAKAAALADVCLEWGPFGDGERARALADVESLALGKLLSLRRAETPTAWWVVLPPFASKAAADRRASELKTSGQKDVVVVESGSQRFVISLGAFRTEDAAKAHIVELAKQGISGASVGPRQQVVLQSLLVIRDPQQPVILRLRDLAPLYPGAEVKIGGCEKPA